MNPKPENFPNTLRTNLKWLVWSPRRKPDGGFTKIPLNPKFSSKGIGKYAKSNDDSTWGSLELAIQTFERFQDIVQPTTGMKLGGFGYVNQGDFLAVDLDDCLTDGKPNAEVAGLIEELNSYTEISPSGKGLRILLEIPEGLEVNTMREELNYRGLTKAEAWTQGKYTTLTGNLYAPHLNEIRRNDGAVRSFLAGIKKTYHESISPKTQTSSGGIYAPQSPEREWTEAEVRQMLNHVSADVGNADWIKIGMALKTWDPGERGRAVFVNWSATAPNRFDDRDANTRWNSFSPGGNGSGRVTLGTLVHLAKQGGFSISSTKTEPVMDKAQPDQEATIEREVDEWLTRLVHWRDLDKIPPAEPILDKWYFKSCITLITGETGTCKSFISLAHSALVATGGSWLGLYDVKKTGPVLYLYLESPGGACVRAKGLGLKKPPEVYFDIRPANLFQPATLDAFVRLIKRKGFVLVIVDVALSVFGAFGKSTTDDMGAFMACCRTITTETGAGVSIIHHPPKSDAGGAHGGMESFALADVWWVGAKKGELMEFRNVKQKEGELEKPMLLAKKKVPLGGLVVGDSVVVELANQAGRAEEATTNDLAFLRALQKATDSNGGPVQRKEWCELAKSRYKMASGSFGDSRVRLIDLGLVQKSGNPNKPDYGVSLAGILFLKQRGRNE